MPYKHDPLVGDASSSEPSQGILPCPLGVDPIQPVRWWGLVVGVLVLAYRGGGRRFRLGSRGSAGPLYSFGYHAGVARHYGGHAQTPGMPLFNVAHPLMRRHVRAILLYSAVVGLTSWLCSRALSRCHMTRSLSAAIIAGFVIFRVAHTVAPGQACVDVQLGQVLINRRLRLGAQALRAFSYKGQTHPSDWGEVCQWCFMQGLVSRAAPLH
jgi:hypothetical protein